MLEWLKPILGESYTEDIDKKISAEISKSFVAKSDFDAADEARKAAETQLTEANKTIAGYKEMDIDAIRQSAADWQAKAEQAQKDADARVDAVQFDGELNNEIIKAGGRNPKAIKALLDVDTLRGSKDRRTAIASALDALKQGEGYLFSSGETPPPYAAGTGTGTVKTEKQKDGVEAAFAALNPKLKF